MDFNSIDMRKFMIYSILICSSIFVEAQNNLVFNQVLNFRVTSTATATVPEGKVWKVEYLTPSTFTGSIFRVNNVEAPYGSPLIGGGFDQAGGNNVMWFSEGTVLSATQSGSVSLSILEFNVVPISSTGSGTVDTGISNGTIPGDDYTPGESFSDADGNTYETVEINGQTWTTTNLNVSTYRDGTPIPYISDFSEWQNTSYGAYTYAGQDSEAGYGKLYNAYAIIGKHDNDGSTPNKILAPEGYHIPNTTEWSNLIYIYTQPIPFTWVTVGVSGSNSWEADVASSFLKSQTSWDNNGTNESGLNIKNYPVIMSNTSSTLQANFYDIEESDGWNYTTFAVNQIQSYNGAGYFQIQGIRIGEFDLESVIIGKGSQAITGGYTSGGTYVRLIKDY